MGCVSSKGDINDRHPNVFHVWNVDDMGNILVPGRIEITETELVLHQRGKEAVRWPMRCLRRYGFETELFSFESGRRCATGAGIYAFRCRRAEALFNLLQEYIQCCGQEEGVGGHGLSGHVGHAHGNGMAMAAAAAANGSMLRPNSVPSSVTLPAGNNASDANYLEPIVRHRTRSSTSRDGIAQIATLSLPNNLALAGGPLPTGPNGELTAEAGEQHGYMNDLGSAMAPGNGSQTDRGSYEGSQRSPLTPPVGPNWMHEYANTAPSIVETSVDNVVDSRASDAKGSDSGAGRDVGASIGKGLVSNGVSSDSGGKCGAHDGRQGTAPYSLLDLRRRRNTHKVGGATAVAVAAATTASVAGSGISVPSVSGVRRQVVLLRGHSLDDDGTNNYARLDDLLRQEAQEDLKRHLYINVVPDGSASKRRDKAASMVVGYREHFYANVVPSGVGTTTQKEMVASDEPKLSTGDPNQGTAQSRNHHHRHSNSLGGIAGLMHRSALQQVNYAVLDLNHRGSSSSGGSGSIGGGTSGVVNGSAGAGSDTAPTSPTGLVPATAVDSSTTLAVGGRDTALEGYATIDFDKTAALSNTVNPEAGGAASEDEAVRRTRHDANINDVMPQLLMLGRQAPHGSSVAGD